MELLSHRVVKLDDNECCAWVTKVVAILAVFLDKKWEKGNDECTCGWKEVVKSYWRKSEAGKRPFCMAIGPSET